MHSWSDDTIEYPANPYVVLADVLIATLFGFLLYILMTSHIASYEAALVAQHRDRVKDVAKKHFGDRLVLDEPGPDGRMQGNPYKNLGGKQLVLKIDHASAKFIFVDEGFFKPRTSELTQRGRKLLREFVGLVTEIRAPTIAEQALSGKPQTELGQSPTGAPGPDDKPAGDVFVALAIQAHASWDESSRPGKGRNRELWRLSALRAAAVVTELTEEHGLPAEKMIAAGRGWRQLLPGYGRSAAVNRRIQIEIRFTSRKSTTNGPTSE